MIQRKYSLKTNSRSALHNFFLNRSTEQKKEIAERIEHIRKEYVFVYT